MKQFLEELRAHHLNTMVDTHYRIGMRVVKTAGAVMVCLVITLLLDSWEAIPIMAIASVVSIQTTHGDTIHTGVFRILGTIIGGVFGILAAVIGLFLPFYNEGLFIIVIPLMLLFNLYTCNFLKMQDSCSISCVVTIIVAARIVYDATVAESLLYTLIRLRDTVLGVGVASVINVLPHYFSKYMEKRKRTT